MSDNKKLFDAAHGNLAASGGAISYATLAAARLALRSQKGLDGKTPLDMLFPSIEYAHFEARAGLHLDAFTASIQIRVGRGRCDGRTQEARSRGAWKTENPAVSMAQVGIME